MVMKPGDIEVGCRIESDDHHGTVKYIGQVPPTKGEWLGIEWDDPARGKHDGSHDGHRYFTTRHPTSGSFIRPKKASAGISLMEAIDDRYGRVDDDTGGIEEEELYVMGNNQKTVVEMVGAKDVNRKQSQLSELREMSFRRLPVYGLPSGVCLDEKMLNVSSLDLSITLIPSWEEVALITKGLSRLKTLNVGSNRLRLPSNPSKLCSSFTPVKALLMHRLDYTWDQVLQCVNMFPSITDLHCCFNQISTISKLEGNITKLKVLNLENNPVHEWSRIDILGQLQLLETLILNDTGLDKIRFAEAQHGSKTKSFPRLSTLYLINNRIQDWRSIDELNKLENLNTLILNKNPIVQRTESYSEDTARYIVVAKVAGLTKLNRTEVPSDERKGAEYDYLKMFGKEWRDSGGNQDLTQNNPSQEFCERHPRYMGLIHKYGAPEDSLFKVHSSALKNSLLSIQITSPNVPEKAPVKKKLPDSMTVQKLKSLLHRLYEADLVSMKVTYISQKMQGQEFELDSDQREIGYYSVEDGDNIVVSW